MKERPILFSAPMVRAILDGRKTQTRRMLRHSPQPPRAIYKDTDCRPVQIQDCWGFEWECDVIKDHAKATHRCPYGKPGDRLWVKETWGPADGGFCYRASEGPRVKPDDGRWHPAIHMFREASRITLENLDIRIERLIEITEEEAIAEGVVYRDSCWFATDDPKALPWMNPSGAYRELWESINGPGSWDANPWVWVIQFRKV